MNKIISLVLMTTLFLSCDDKRIEEEGFLEVEDSKIHYKISGEGKPVLLLHGGLLNLDSWNYQIKELNDNHFKTIRYSELGHGKSQNGDVKIKGVEIIDEFIRRKCGDEKVSIIGLSWGGVLATDYTLKHPEKVEKLILVSPGINGWDWFEHPETKEKYEKLRKAYTENDSTRVGELNYEYWIIGPKRKETDLQLEIREELKNMIDENISINWGKPKSQLDTVSSIHRLHEIKTPTLIVSGEKDESDILEIGNVYENGIRNSKREVIKGVGHSLNVEKPRLFNAMVLDFLKN